MSEEVTKKRTRKSANYMLERLVDLSEVSKEIAESFAEKFAIFEVASGFVSPEKAFEFAEARKLKGTFRVVRVASELFEGAVVNPEPIYSLKKLSLDDKAPKVRKPRKSREVVSGDTNTNLVRQAALVKDPLEEAIAPEDEGLNPDPDGV